MDEQKNRHVLDKIKKFEAEHSGACATYDMQTGVLVEYDAGYQVSFVRREAFDVLKPCEWDKLTDYVCEYLDSDAYIGVYDGVEVSFHSYDRKRTIEIMELFNQETALDWAQKKKHPQQDEYLYIFNQSFDNDGVVDYEKILRTL